MIKRFSLTVILAGALAASACAREADSAEADSAEADSADIALDVAVQDAAPEAVYEFSAEAWRDLDPENTLYIETDHGRIVVELAPEFAPVHVERMKTLARQNFYDFLVWHRVIDGFMAQGGGARAQPNHRTELPSMQQEFSIRRGAEMDISELQDRQVSPSIPQMAKAGFWNGFHAGTQTMALAGLTGDGQVVSWLMHCQGAAAMARTNDPNSAGSQFYITRGHADHLNATYTVWGRVRAGQDAVNAIRVGTLGQDVGFTPDVIRSIRVAADIDESERSNIQVVDTDSAEFAAYLDTLRDEAGEMPDICEIQVPTRIAQ